MVGTGLYLVPARGRVAVMATCPCCQGTKQVRRRIYDSDGAFRGFSHRVSKCENCSGIGKVPRYVRVTLQ